MQVTGLQRTTFAAEDVRAVVGTRARQASIRTPDPGPSTATDHLGTAQACHQGEVGERSLEAAGTVGGRPGMSGVTAGAGASEVALRTSKGKGDRVGVRSTEGLTETPGSERSANRTQRRTLWTLWPRIRPEAPTAGAFQLDQHPDGPGPSIARPGGSRMAGVGLHPV